MRDDEKTRDDETVGGNGAGDDDGARDAGNDPGAGERNLDYGHAFGTQRDRSAGREPDYVEPHHDTVQDEALKERRRRGDASRE